MTLQEMLNKEIPTLGYSDTNFGDDNQNDPVVLEYSQETPLLKVYSVPSISYYVVIGSFGYSICDGVEDMVDAVKKMDILENITEFARRWGIQSL